MAFDFDKHILGILLQVRHELVEFLFGGIGQRRLTELELILFLGEHDLVYQPPGGLVHRLGLVSSGVATVEAWVAVWPARCAD
jgi:hypothetical protein